MSDLEIRDTPVDLEFREEEEEGVIEGWAVRYGEAADIGGKYREAFERGAFDGAENVKLYRDHREIIGHVVSVEDREEGLWVKAKVATTSLGRDTLALLRSGALNRLSIGFRPVEHREESGVLIRTRALLKEVSVVENPAYAGAQILHVRGEETPIPGDEIVTDSVTPADVTELRSAIEETNRRVETLAYTAPAEAAVDQRSAGAFLQAIVRGDEASTDAYHRAMEHQFDEVQTRAFDGSVLADAPVKDAWVGDLTRLFDASSGVLSNFFSTGTLPEKGQFIEFAELQSNTVTVAEQENEGDDLPVGKVQLKTRTAEVHTYGGALKLSRQVVERSTLPVLNRNLEALALAAGANKKAVLRAEFNKLVQAREAIATNGGVMVLGSTLAASDAGRWEDLIIDAAIRFDSENATPEILIVSASVFKKFRALTVSGERVFEVDNGNHAGRLNLPGLTGNLAGLTVQLDPQATGDKAVFAHSRALRQYDSALASLSDENVINLTQAFSVYRYGAVAAEIPQLVVPVKLAAS